MKFLLENIESLTCDQLLNLKNHKCNKYYLTAENLEKINMYYDIEYKKLINERTKQVSAELSKKKKPLEEKQEQYNSLLSIIKDKCIDRYGNYQEFEKLTRCFKGDKNNMKILLSEIKGLEKIIKRLR